ncbi:putative porin [Reichenbachiella versicolor]|uniref:putative porin n=1 Tax=Reichenbachiella versicolor TaxID=1821036 RepID=UPI000D6DCCCB|nr:putative porin [Reichenbachiella versicolor]
MKKLLLIVILLELISLSSFAQILDDSTKLVYGPTTTRYKTVLDLKHSDTLYHIMDTSLYDLERFQEKYKHEMPYYDLGVNGTALQPMYYSLPDQIGRTTGFTAYEPYYKKVSNFRYYDTKSPYINLNAVFAGKQRSTVDFEFSRNINPQWNIGFDIHRINSNKQIGSAGLREKQAENTELDFYTFHRSEGGKYQMMFHAYKMEHKLFEETGGVDEPDPKDYFLYRNASIALSATSNTDFRQRFYLYHQYSIMPSFEVYNSIEQTRKQNQFISDLSIDGDYYDFAYFDSDSTFDKSQLDELDIELGIKGRVVNHIYYTAFARRRALNQKTQYLGEYGKEFEYYLGGDLVFHLNDKNEIGGEVQLMNEGQYQFKSFLHNNIFEASYSSMTYRPSYLVEGYLGNHYEWNNAFNSTFANSIQGALHYDFGFVFLEPEAEITTLTDYIYFNTDKLPAQNTGTLLINKYGLIANFKIWNHLHFDNQIVFNNVAGDNSEVMQIADWNLSGKWYYANILFKGDMEMQLGLDVRWQSEYFGLGYDPITQQFYNQYELRTPSYFVADLFFVMKKDNISIWVKSNYVNQQRDSGYFEVPFYPGMRRVFDFGVRWMFFD